VKTHRSRQIVLGLVALVAAVVVLNVVGLLRYPGGPLRDPSDDGPLLLDMRPADQGSDAVGNSQPSDWAIAGQSYDFGVLTIHNPTPFTATVEAVTPLDPTPGLTLVAVYVRRTGSPSTGIVAFGPSGQDPDPATLDRDFVALPATVVPTGDTHEQDAEVVVVVRSDRAGAFGFSALALDYRIGPFTFHAIQHLALAGCLGPLPVGVTCPSSE
jgi:hypothetical protein